MSALVRRFEREVHVHLLARLDAIRDAASRFRLTAAALVEAVLRIDERALIRDQPLDTVVVAAFLIRREREDDVAIGHESLLLHAQEVGDEDRGHRLVVGRASAIVVTVLFDELERIEIGRPVFFLGFDDVDVRKEQKRLQTRRATPSVSHDEVAFARVRTADEDVGGRKPRSPKTRGHRLGGNGGAADAVRRVDFNELLVDVVRELLVRRPHLGGDRCLPQQTQRRRSGDGQPANRGRGWHPQRISRRAFQNPSAAGDHRTGRPVRRASPLPLQAVCGEHRMGLFGGQDP